MGGGQHSSKGRFREYKRAHRERHRLARSGGTPGAPGAGSAASAGGAILSEQEQRSRRRRQRSFFALFAAFWGMLRGHRGRLAAALGTLTVATLLALISPASTKVVIDYIVTDNPGPAGIPEWLGLGTDRIRLLWMVGAALVALAVVSASVGVWGRWHATRITKRLQASMRRRVFEHAVRLPLHRVYGLKSGGVASILREDAGGIGELVFSLVYNPWRAIVQLVATLAILAWTDWRFLVGALLLIPAVWMSHRAWIGRIRPVYRDIRATRQHIDSHATEAFGGMRVVRGFNRHRGEAGRFVRSNHLMARQELYAWWWSRGIEIVWQLMIPVSLAAVLIYGGMQVVWGRMTIGDVMMFSAYLMLLLGPLETLVATATNIQSNLAGLDRVLDLLEEPTELSGTAGGGIGSGTGAAGMTLVGLNGAVGAGAGSRLPALGRITFDDVSFSYPRGEGRRGGESGSHVEGEGGHGALTRPLPKGEGGQEALPERVLEHINLDVMPGMVVALVGPSGSGKTTLCNLVARFYDPTEGAIRLDGVDLRELDVDLYRSLLGIVEQDVFLFDGTVAENIGYAKRNATMEEIRRAARAANADGFIQKLDRGYETLIGERGVRLSGGQKQRIAIARALLAEPRILILDEATSNLDSESEALIQESLEELMKGRTCFVIAHRLSTIRHADLIVVLEGGRIIETGTHEQLIAAEGRYAEMLRVQLRQEDEVEAEVVEGEEVEEGVGEE